MDDAVLVAKEKLAQMVQVGWAAYHNRAGPVGREEFLP